MWRLALAGAIVLGACEAGDLGVGGSGGRAGTGGAGGSNPDSSVPLDSGGSNLDGPVNAPCDYYAAPEAVGDGLSQGSPFRIHDFWSVAGPGKTLCLLDGTYQGQNNMIHPPRGLSGSSGSPITIRALNDGAVTLDPQFSTAWTGGPVILLTNSWFVLEGFNAKNGGSFFYYDSNNNILRRVVMWDGPFDGNTEVFGIHASTGPNLVEDCAFFGMSRKVFNNTQGGNNTTFRRIWTRYEGSSGGGGYGYSTWYNNSNSLNENVIATWDQKHMPATYDGPYGHMTDYEVWGAGPIGIDHSLATDGCVHADLYGSIAYFKADSLVRQRLDLGGNLMAVRYKDPVSCFLQKDVLAFVHPSNDRYSSIGGFYWGHFSPEGNPPSPDYGQRVADHITSIRYNIPFPNGSVGDVLDNRNSIPWSITNKVAGQTLADVVSQDANPWTGTSGANLCYRYVDGQRQDGQGGRPLVPLWPWPMNERIKQATASAGVYNGPCTNCVGGRAARTATDVTAEIESLLGPIPSQCKASSATPPPPTPPPAP